MMHILVAFMIGISMLNLFTCQEPLPDDVWKMIASHCHYSVGRCINRFFRDNISCIHIDRPVRLDIGPLADYKYYKEQEKKQNFLYQGIKEGTIKMHDTWILEGCYRESLYSFLRHMRGQESLKLKIPLGEGGSYEDVHSVFVSALNDFILKNKVLKELSISYDNKDSVASIGLVPFGLRIAKESTLKKLSLEIATLKTERGPSITPWHMRILQVEIEDNACLEEVTVTVERHPVRLRPEQRGDMAWFEFMCDVKAGRVKSKKAKAPWYWSGDPTKHT